MILVLSEKEFNCWKEIMLKTDSPELLSVHNQLFGNGERPNGVSTTLVNLENGRGIQLELAEPVAVELLSTIRNYVGVISDATKNLPSIGKFLIRLKNFGRDLAAVFKKK